ncbi:hypothetical protein MIR68_005759 [Amoeboaphelidium protococcarum]|nr:hypothetical protein MIR68_005759 [Amoeboaphelidium protococcarum]
MDFLLGDAMLQRGDEKRRILLSDIAIRIYPSQSATGPSPAICLVITMNQGKTLKNGRVQYAGCFRGLDVLTCPVAAVGFYLQYRWMKDSSCPFPDFSSRKSWYDIVLLKSVEDETEALTYQSQHAVLSKCFKDLNIMISKVTHSNRMAGAQMLEQHDVERAGIQNHGRWRGDDLQSSYLTNLSLRSMRLLSGARGKGQYYIPRAAISVPEVFSEKVFPQLKVAKAVVMDAGREEQDLAAKHFLDLLEQLSVIMCQDAVILMYEYPNSSLWTLPPYCLPEFKQWRSDIALNFLTSIPPRQSRMLISLPRQQPIINNWPSQRTC